MHLDLVICNYCYEKYGRGGQKKYHEADKLKLNDLIHTIWFSFNVISESV